MIELHPNILSSNGKEQFVVLPYDEFIALTDLLEDAEDIVLLRKAREENAGEQGVSAEEAKKQLGL
jgi:PHD/YefM family antitoxin component YafN of YafNO toxin-antitoxin module